MHQDAIILIAEDDEGNFVLTRNLLRKSGIDNEIIRFDDGQEVVDFLLTNKCEHGCNHNYMLLLDIRMPKMDGIEVLRQIRAVSGFREMTVIMVSASDSREIIEECMALGCSDYIVKPADESLVNAIKIAC